MQIKITICICLWQEQQIRVRPQAFQVSEKLGSYSSQPVRCWLYPSIINTIFKLKITWYLHDSNPQPLNLALYPTELKKYMVVPQHNRWRLPLYLPISQHPYTFQVPPNNFHNNDVVDSVSVECNLGFKIGQDVHSCKGAIGTETWTCYKGNK
jgi:hypothetical protein